MVTANFNQFTGRMKFLAGTVADPLDVYGMCSSFQEISENSES